MGFNSSWQNHMEELDEKQKLLKKAKTIEKKRISQGWRWFSVGNTTKILVPFGKDGKPTKEGLEAIKRKMENLGINKV